MRKNLKIDQINQAEYTYENMYITYKEESMETKLTLSMQKKTIEKAKQYAKSHKTSISQLVEKYLEAIANNEKMELENLGPLTKSLIPAMGFSSPLSAKELLKDALAEKYL